MAAAEALFPGSTSVPRSFELRFVELTREQPLEVGGVRVTPFEVSHPSGAPPYALRFEVDGKVLASRAIPSGWRAWCRPAAAPTSSSWSATSSTAAALPYELEDDRAEPRPHRRQAHHAHAHGRAACWPARSEVDRSARRAGRGRPRARRMTRARERRTSTACVREIRACRICRRHARTGGRCRMSRAPCCARARPRGSASAARRRARGCMPRACPSPTRPAIGCGPGWAVSSEEFYDQRRVAIVPMGFCFPGHDATGGDLPPRRECAPAWHARLFAAMPQLELILLVGSYAQRWHLGERRASGQHDGHRQALARRCSTRQARPALRAAAASVLAQQWVAHRQSLVRDGPAAGRAPRGAAAALTAQRRLARALARRARAGWARDAAPPPCSSQLIAQGRHVEARALQRLEHAVRRLHAGGRPGPGRPPSACPTRNARAPAPRTCSRPPACRPTTRSENRSNLVVGMCRKREPGRRGQLRLLGGRSGGRRTPRPAGWR